MIEEKIIKNEKKNKLSAAIEAIDKSQTGNII